MGTKSASGKGNRKKGRNEKSCQAYRAANRQETNQVLRIMRHLRRHPIHSFGLPKDIKAALSRCGDKLGKAKMRELTEGMTPW